MTPPELTDSESEEESEEETEDDMLRSYRPSRKYTSGTSRHTESDGCYLSKKLLTSKSVSKNKETSNANTDSSDEDAEKLQIDKETNKSRLHKNRITHHCHPSGRFSPIIEHQRHTTTSKEIGSVTAREKEV